MLELIASKPCSMAGISFSEEDEQLIRNAEKEGHKISTISYFHGNIETLAGYDIGVCINAEQCFKSLLQDKSGIIPTH